MTSGSGYPVPDHLVRAVRRMARSGRTIAEICRATGLSRGTVRKLLIIRRNEERERDNEDNQDPNR
jgi:transposase-like protein